MIWKRQVFLNKNWQPHRIATDPEGKIYICEYGGYIYVISADGEPVENLTTSEIHGPMALCMNSTGRYMCVADLYNKVYLLSVDGSQVRFLLKTYMYYALSVVRCMCLYHDRYLAVGTNDALRLYDISSVF